MAWQKRHMTRNQRIVLMGDAGETKAVIALTFGITIERVRQILVVADRDRSRRNNCQGRGRIWQKGPR